MTGSSVGPDDFYFNVRNMSGSETRGKMQYIERDGQEQVEVRDRAGRAMTETEKERFIQKAERHDYCQRWQITPPNGNDLSREELQKETRRVANGYTADKRTSSVAYAVHENSERNNVHVLIAGEESELRMNRDDIKQTRTRSHEHMTEKYRERKRQQEREQKRRKQKQRERQQQQQQRSSRGISR